MNAQQTPGNTIVRRTVTIIVLQPVVRVYVCIVILVAKHYTHKTLGGPLSVQQPPEFCECGPTWRSQQTSSSSYLSNIQALASYVLT